MIRKLASLTITVGLALGISFLVPQLTNGMVGKIYGLYYNKIVLMAFAFILPIVPKLFTYRAIYGEYTKAVIKATGKGAKRVYGALEILPILYALLLFISIAFIPQTHVSAGIASFWMASILLNISLLSTRRLVKKK